MSERAVVLYERPGCHLCEEAARLLAPLARELGFTVRRVNIEADDGLLRRYALEIPVVALDDGVELARAPLDDTALRRALRGAANSP